MDKDSANEVLPPKGEPAGVVLPPPSGVPVGHGGAAIPAPPSGVPVSKAASPEPVANSPFSTSQSPFSPPEGQPLVFQDMSQKDGITKCFSCGSSDIQLNMNTGLLHCNYCHREFSEISDGIDSDITRLSGVRIGSGVTDIVYDASDVVTIKCTACGAEVVVDTKEAPQARCHWCRNMLSLNQQVPNGAIPDAVMPFRIPKERAQKLIEQFVGKRRTFAHPRFKAEFTTQNIMGVYLPYMVIDVNAHAQFRGEGEHETRRYTVGSGNNKQTRYDADAYWVGRDFDFYIDDLTIEASGDKLDQTTAVNSNTVINAILPFPLKETVRFNANYLRGFTSEKRSVNRSMVENLVGAQVRDIARWQAWQSSTYYNRGIRWDVEDLTVKGELWKTVYLPVWLYSYLEQKSNGKKFLHYVAVNACTGETMGSVPIHKPKLLAVSAVIEAIGLVVGVGLAILLLLGG